MEGRAALTRAERALAAGDRELTVVERLRASHGGDRSRAAMAVVEGRQSAAAKFADAGRLYFDREAAEQATSELVARHTAARFAGCPCVLDLCAGAGGDALALALHADVLAVDRDAGRLAMLEANAEARGLAGRIRPLELDVLNGRLPAADAAWIDPSRRGARGRSYDPERWSPTLRQAIDIARGFRGAGIKVAPGLDLRHVPADAEIEFISLRGELVEAVIWVGDLRSASRRATRLPEAATLSDADATASAEVRAPGAHLYDPDAAVGRAGLIDGLAAALGAWKLDARVAYLSSDRPIHSPWVRRYRVRATLPFSERGLLRTLRELGATRVDVTRRAAPVDTNALEVRLNRALPGGGRSDHRGDHAHRRRDVGDRGRAGGLRAAGLSLSG